MITIVNYGSGNIQAILNIYKEINISCRVANSPEELRGATKLILPGVGAFDKTMGQLIDSGFKQELDILVLEKNIPVMGICVGMQILANKSEEGNLRGLGYINGEVRKFDASKLTQKPFLPHMGWNSISLCNPHKIFEDVDLEKGFYFLHTYFFSCNSNENMLASTNYGGEFASSVNNKNIFGMQFHPEKSHSNGIKLFRNFANL